MLKYIDFGGGDGVIQYTEFLIAGSNKVVLFKEENLQKEFKFLDLDQDGFIGLEDIESFMTGICSEIAFKKGSSLQSIKQMLKEIKRAYAKWKLENQVQLSDETTVNDIRWGGLKKVAMDKDFEGSE